MVLLEAKVVGLWLKSSFLPEQTYSLLDAYGLSAGILSAGLPT